MALTYTDYGKTLLHTWGRFRVTLFETVERGDMLSWYNSSASYAVQLADQSDSQRADCIACEKGDQGDTIWACLKAEMKAPAYTATGGSVTQNYFAASTDYLGSALYLGEDGKPSSTSGSTYFQEVGKVLARDRILIDLASSNVLGETKFGADDKGVDVYFYGATTGNYLLWDASNDYLTFYGDEHFYINTNTDGRNIRLNSRDVTTANTDHTAVQIKPQMAVDGTGSGTGLEVSPRFADACGGNDLRAILADPVLKGTTGDITGQVVAVECNIDLGDSGSTRTITGDVSAFSSFLDLPSGVTTSALVSFLRVRAVNVSGWEAFLNLDDANTGCTQAAAAGSGGHRYLKVYEGATLYTIDMVCA